MLSIVEHVSRKNFAQCLHQAGFQYKAGDVNKHVSPLPSPKAYSGIKLSSAGLVFKHFGGKVGTCASGTSQLDSLDVMMLEASDWSFGLIQMDPDGCFLCWEMWNLEVVEALCGPLEEKAKVALLTEQQCSFLVSPSFYRIPEELRIGDLTAVGV